VSIEPGALAAKVEALLFVSPRPVRIGAIARFLKAEARAVKEAIDEITTRSADRAVAPVQVAEGWQLRTKPEHGEMVRQFLQARPARMSRAAMETMAIVAYRQPVTRAEIEDIRGVDTGAVLRGLLERRLVRILGKRDEPGRPILYGTAPAFLEVFGLRSLKELPTLREFVELSEEHQRIVDERAPDREAAAADHLREYLEDLERSPAADEWADQVARSGGEARGRADDGFERTDDTDPLTDPSRAGNGDQS